jgi:hypothetical protein
MRGALPLSAISRSSNLVVFGPRLAEPKENGSQDLGSACHGDSTTLAPFCLRLVASTGPIGKSSRRSYPDKDTMEVTLGIVLAIGLAFIWVVQGVR